MNVWDDDPFNLMSICFPVTFQQVSFDTRFKIIWFIALITQLEQINAHSFPYSDLQPMLAESQVIISQLGTC